MIRLAPKSVATFYREVMDALRELDIPVKINTTPNEVDPAIPFEQNEKNAAYDPEYANRFWRVLLQSDRVFKEFRAEFCGKCSPVHFFWGSFDLAVTRFSGRLRTATSWGRPAFARRGGARSVFARGEQSWVLAGERNDARADLLFLCVSGAGRIFRRESEPGGGGIQQCSSGNFCFHTRQFAGGDA